MLFLAVFVVKEICNGCGMCEEACPNGAVMVHLKVAVVDPENVKIVRNAYLPAR